jgi:hypothetical protein
LLFKTEAESSNLKNASRNTKSRKELTRQRTDEDIKKLYGIRKVDRETKHLDIMIEMAQTTASLGSCHGKKNSHRSSSSQHSHDKSNLAHGDAG